MSKLFRPNSAYVSSPAYAPQGAEEPNLTFTRSIFELCTRAVSCVIRSVVFEFSPQRDLKRNRRFPSEALSSYCVTILRRPQSAVCGYPTESSDYVWGPGGAKNRLENNRSNIESVKVKFGSSAPCVCTGIFDWKSDKPVKQHRLWYFYIDSEFPDT